MLFNASKAYVRQLERSERYEVLQPVIGLSLLDDIFRPETEQFYHHYQLAEESHPEAIIEGIKLVFIELPKFKASGLKRKLAVAWLRFLKETGDVGTDAEAAVLEQEIASVAPELKEAVTLAREGGFTPGELDAYDRYWDAVRSERTLLEGKTAQAREEGLAEGRAEGRVEGLAEGLAEGESIGIERGRQLERLAIIERLMASSMPKDDALRVVGEG